MISQKIHTAIREVPDFPKPGINFKDITTLLLDPILSNEIIDAFIERLKGKKIDAIVGVESRGFLFGFLLDSLVKSSGAVNTAYSRSFICSILNLMV